MATESTEQALRQLLTQSKDSRDADYASGETVSGNDLILELMLRKKLVAAAHSANIMESIEASVRKGGGTGECAEQHLLKTGLTGWT